MLKEGIWENHLLDLRETEFTSGTVNVGKQKTKSKNEIPGRPLALGRNLILFFIQFTAYICIHTYIHIYIYISTHRLTTLSLHQKGRYRESILVFHHDDKY